ncbi:MAG: hypothetical protein O2809_10910 [Proteobacteria bacterium]|nr:hypothetical protein [Pseudomonadota bacterium]
MNINIILYYSLPIFIFAFVVGFLLFNPSNDAVAKIKESSHQKKSLFLHVIQILLFAVGLYFLAYYGMLLAFHIVAAVLLVFEQIFVKTVDIANLSQFTNSVSWFAYIFAILCVFCNVRKIEKYAIQDVIITKNKKTPSLFSVLSK